MMHCGFRISSLRYRPVIWETSRLFHSWCVTTWKFVYGVFSAVRKLQGHSQNCRKHAEVEEEEQALQQDATLIASLRKCMIPYFLDVEDVISDAIETANEEFKAEGNFE